MKLHVLCDCDNNKVVTGNFDGQPMWHYKTAYDKQMDIERKIAVGMATILGNRIHAPFTRDRLDLDEWQKDEAYKQNSD